MAVFCPPSSSYVSQNKPLISAPGGLRPSTAVAPSLRRDSKLCQLAAATWHLPAQLPRGRRTAGGRPMTVCQVAGAAAMPTGPMEGEAEGGESVSLGRKIRAVAFYIWCLSLSTVLFIPMILFHPFVILFDKVRRLFHHIVNGWWARATMAPFYSVEIIGRENLPPSEVSAVYVANHQSFLDIFTLFALGRPFKFISKIENFRIPIIGWSMYLTGHVPLKRLDSRSQRECLIQCLNLLKDGASVLFFPEGTRTRDGKMDQFKKGAFSLAAKSNSPVVPISLIGTGHLMPNSMEGTLRPGKVIVVIHPPLSGTNADKLCEESREIIGNTLKKYGLGVH